MDIMLVLVFPEVFLTSTVVLQRKQFYLLGFLFPASTCTWLRKYHKDYNMLEGKGHKRILKDLDLQ